MEREYLDARFDSLEKILNLQETNLKGYIGAVSANVKEVRTDLQAHKESMDAHGLASSRNSSSTIASWLGLGIAACLGVAEFFKGHRQ